MDMFDQARAMSGTIELCKITQAELARRMGVSQSYIANKIRLLSLPQRVIQVIKDNKVSERHARSILRLDSEEKQLEILDKVIRRSLTVRECEALVDMETVKNYPCAVSKAETGKKIETFRSSLKESIAIMRSEGVEITERTSILGSRLYISLCISNI